MYQMNGKDPYTGLVFISILNRSQEMVLSSIIYVCSKEGYYECQKREQNNLKSSTNPMTRYKMIPIAPSSLMLSPSQSHSLHLLDAFETPQEFCVAVVFAQLFALFT